MAVNRRALRALGAALLFAGCAGRVPPPAPPIPEAERTLSIFLIGDAGKPEPGDPVLAELAAQTARAPRGSVIVFLGDNLYPRGMPAAGTPERNEMERRLDAQVNVARTSGLRAIFIPGNHDWDRMGPDGWDAVRRSEEFIQTAGKGSAEQLPRGGCPGPETVDVGAAFRLVLLDTEWWLQKPAYPKPRDTAGGCAAGTEADIEARLAEALAGADGRQVIVAGHHPIRTDGEHGGHFPIEAHLFPLRAIKKWLWIPLPLLGSLYPAARGLGISAQDMSGGANKRMRAALERAMSAHPPLLYAAGHDHGLQVFRGPVAAYSVVSGAGIVEHESGVGRIDATVYASSKPGFMRLDLSPSGTVRLSVTVVERRGPREALGLLLDRK